MTVTAEMVPTDVGTLHVEVDGEGPPAVLWHSLFVDSTTWHRLRPLLRADRRLVLIDGPGHGRSSAAPGFTFGQCPAAALQVLDALGEDGPVDWVGNAWGGHVGLTLAAQSPDRVRSLVTIATPAQALRTAERMKILPLVWAYRAFGAVPPLANALAQVLLGETFMKSQPEDTALVIRALRGVKRSGMHRAMRSVMLDRPDITPLLAQIRVPTVMVAPRNDPMLTVQQVRAAVDRMPHASAVELEAEGHIAPILANAHELAELIRDFWKDPSARVV
ncbi:MAG TPA: alpha/beta fold hydrolase [Mycobacterium sp.]|jgi:pimeloyl-ACP methyl ester carboxylesterase